MKLGTTLVTITAATAVASGCSEKVVKDIKTVGSKLDDFASALDSFQGDVKQMLEIQSKSLKIADATQDTTDQIKKCDGVSDSEADDVLKAIDDLVPTIKSTLSKMSDSKDKINKADAGGLDAKTIVKKNLQDLKSKTDDLASVAKDKAPSSFQSKVSDYQDKIDGWFKDALDSFS